MENGGVEIKERLSPLSSAEISTVDLLAEPAFAPFLRPDFDQAQFANNALAGSRTTAVSQMHILRQGISKLDTALQKEVSAAQDDLLVHTRRLVHSDQSLQSLHLSVESLNAALNRVRAEITEPHQQIRAKAKQLRNLRRIIDILRQLSLHLKLFSKLREQLSQSVGEGSSSVFVDLAKAAKLYSDISAVRAEIDLTGIHALEPQVAFLEDAGRQIRSRAAAGLAQGMQSLSQAEVGGALQVFFNLGELPEAVSGLNSKYCSEINRLAKAALDARQYATGGAASGNLQGVVGALAAKASPAGLGKMQEQLWERLGSLAEQVHGSAAAMWHLQRVLVKKRDPVTHIHFSDVLTQQGAALPLPAFWQAATATLSDSFKAAAKPGRAANVRSTLIQHFPRASVLFLDMLDRLEQDTTVKGVQAAADAQQRQALMAVLVPFQQQFLAGVLSRLNDAVSSTFQGGNRALPSPADVQRCIAAIHDELQHAAASSAVVQQVGMAMGKALQHMVERVEYMAASGPEARALGSSCNPAQERNISLCSHLQELHRSLLSLLPRLPAAAAEVLEAPLASLQAAAVQIAAPLLKAMVDAQEALLLRMHAVNYGAEVPPGNDTSGTTQVSPYVRELAALLESCRSTFLAKFAPPPSPNVPSFISALTQRMASRVLVFSMRHGSLLQRLSPAGKVQLVKDLREIEAAVSANLWPVEVLGQPHKMFRSFLSLLFLDTPSIPATPLLTVLPAEVVLHHLFSRLPAGAQLPYQALSLTPEQYSLWIDSHSHSEAVHGALAALDSAPDELCQLPEWQLVHSVMTAVAGPAS